MATKAEIQAELDRVKADHEALRRTVVDTAKDYAENNGWCDTVNDALRDMGLGDLLPSRKRKVTLVYEVDADELGWDSDEDSDESYVEAATEGETWLAEGVRLLDSRVEEVAA